MSNNFGTQFGSDPSSGSNTGLVVAAHVASVAQFWSKATSPTVLGAFDANGSIGNNVLDQTSSAWGTPQTGNSNLPQITINSLVAGTYKVTAVFQVDSSVNSGAAVALNDGTSTVCTVGYVGGGSTAFSATLVGIFKYVATANITFAIFGKANSGNAQIHLDTASASQLTWIIEKIG